jgi:hypothetical protein
LFQVDGAPRWRLPDVRARLQAWIEGIVSKRVDIDMPYRPAEDQESKASCHDEGQRGVRAGTDAVVRMEMAEEPSSPPRYRTVGDDIASRKLEMI